MRTVCVLYGLSGLLSLAYQVVWFRIFSGEFGSTNLTFALVLCSFIGGLGVGALGSAPLSRGLSRMTRVRDPIRVYGLFEILIAASVLLTIGATMIPATTWGVFPYTLDDGVFRPSATYLAASILIAGGCVFIPCVLMGVTFPLLCSAFERPARFPSLLYGWNTLGACTGVLICEFVLLPRIGHERTLWLVAGVNVAIGLLLLLRGRADGVRAVASLPQDIMHGPAPRSGGLDYSVLLAGAIISGLLTGALEGDVFKRLRFLGCAVEVSMSFISFWAIGAIFLGSWTVRALPRLSFTSVRLASVGAVLVYAGTWHFMAPVRGGPVYAVLGDGLAGLLAFTGLFVFPAFFLLSLLLPYLCNRAHADRRHLGIAYGANTVAFCLGVLAFTWIAPSVNVFYSMKLALAVLSILAALLLLLRAANPVPRWIPGAAAVAVVAAAVLTPAHFDPTFFPPGAPPARHPVRAMMSDAAHTTYIVEEPGGDVLYFTHHPMSATDPAAQLYMRLMAHFPLLAQPQPESALLICFGVGNTASAIASHESIERLDVVDLNRNVFATAPEFAAANRDVIDDTRLRLIHDDGRSFLARTDRRYDLVTSEPPPPQHEGVYRLYSREYYDAVRARLTPTGMMTQWLPIFQMSPEAVGLVVGTFVDAFPHTLLITGQSENYVLVGSCSPIDLAVIERRLDPGDETLAAVRADLARLRIRRPIDLLARVVQGDRSLRLRYDASRVISDRRNDLAHLFMRPAMPSVIAYDPVALLEEIDARRLAAGEELRATVMNLARLKLLVRDFPVSALMSVRATGATGVAYADADWARSQDLRFAARHALDTGRLDDAASLMGRALDIVPEQPATLMELGRTQLRLSDFEAALATFDRFVMQQPQSAAGRYGSGYARLRLGRYDEAIEPLEHAVALDPAVVMHHRALGEALAGLGRFDEAVAVYDRALRLDPSDGTSRRHRALAVVEMERHEDKAQARP